MTRVMGRILCIGAFALAAGCQQGGGALSIDKLEPPQGTIAGGEEITIRGDGFQPGKTQAEVRFGHKKADVVTIASTTKIKAVTPPGEKGPVDITVSFDDARTFKIPNGFRYVEPSDNDATRKAFLGGGKPSSANKIELEKK